MTIVIWKIFVFSKHTHTHTHSHTHVDVYFSVDHTINTYLNPFCTLKRCLKDVSCTLRTPQKRLLYVMDCLTNVLLYVMNVLKASFVCYECLKDVFCMLWLFKRCLLYVMIVVKKYILYVMECLKDFLDSILVSWDDIFCTSYQGHSFLKKL